MARFCRTPRVSSHHAAFNANPLSVASGNQTLIWTLWKLHISYISRRFSILIFFPWTLSIYSGFPSQCDRWFPEGVPPWGAERPVRCHRWCKECRHIDIIWYLSDIIVYIYVYLYISLCFYVSILIYIYIICGNTDTNDARNLTCS